MPSYGQDEPDDTFFEQDEPEEDFEPDAEIDPADAEAGGAGDGDVEDRLVAVGDPNQQAGAQKPATDADKRIPDDKRTTTPYMTKYERARVLGTRALQIR